MGSDYLVYGDHLSGPEQVKHQHAEGGDAAMTDPTSCETPFFLGMDNTHCNRTGPIPVGS